MWQDFQEFLIYLRKPFAFRKFVKFSRRNWLILTLAFLSSVYWIGKNLGSLWPEILPEDRSLPFTILDPATFKINSTSGYPNPAIDREGDLVPIIEDFSPRWVIWSVRQRRAIFYATGHPAYNEYANSAPAILYSESRKQFIVAFDATPTTWIWELHRRGVVCVIDAQTMQVTKQIYVPRMVRLVGDISPSGRYFAVLGDFWFICANPPYEGQPIILDLDTGDISRKVINDTNFFFDSDSSLVSFTWYGISRIRLNSAPPFASIIRRHFKLRTQNENYSESEFVGMPWRDAQLHSTLSVSHHYLRDRDNGIDRRDRGIVRFRLDASDVLTSYTFPAKYGLESGASNAPGDHYNLRDGPGSLNASRNLFIAVRNSYAEGGNFSKSYWLLVDPRNGIEFVLEDSSNKNWNNLNFRFVNSDWIAARDGSKIEFLRIDDLLAKVDPWR